MTEAFDQFQAWLMDMDDVLDRFIASAPADKAASLDSSAASLDVLEGLIPSDYPTVADAKAPGEANRLDGYARYIGELFRKHFGGRWNIELGDEKNAFFGMPQISRMRGQQVQLCPLTLVTAAVDRRSGKLLRTIFESYRKKQGSD